MRPRRAGDARAFFLCMPAALILWPGDPDSPAPAWAAEIDALFAEWDKPDSRAVPSE
jgi:hypothetical protein